MKIHRFARPAVIAAAAVTLVAAACSNTSSTSSSNGSTSGGFQGTALNGAGSTFAQPLYQLWSQSFLQKEPDAQINYQPIGSGGGIEQFTAETVDFGATDVPLQSDEIGNLPNQNYIEFPTALGAVVFAYNVQGVDTPLKLDGEDDLRHLPGQRHQVERRRDHQPEPGREPPGRVDPGGPPIR